MQPNFWNPVGYTRKWFTRQREHSVKTRTYSGPFKGGENNLGMWYHYGLIIG
jgi:hypothetical protein